METPTGTVVCARDLSLHYRTPNPNNRAIAVSGANFEIAAGEVVAVVGETGSGKSTLARTVAGLAGLPGGPSIRGGSLSVLGMPVRYMSHRQRDWLSLRVGYVPQDAGSHLAPRLTVGENIAEPIFARDPKFDQFEAGEAVATLVDAVRLPLATMNMYPHELSKGQRQRIAVARALILDPQLLVADDPTAGIDVLVRGAILDIIKELQQLRTFSAFIVTADLSEVKRVSTRLMVMHRGFIVGHGEIDEVLADPTHPYVAGLATARRPDLVPERLGVN